MSEIKLNLVDAQQVLSGKIHGSFGDYVVSALSAEPETLAELESALIRFVKPFSAESPFAHFRSNSTIDDVPWDAGIVVVDLTARIVATESIYSQPGPQGEVHYHDGTQLTDLPLRYQLPDDWLFVQSIDEYNDLYETRRKNREANPPLDTRAVLYGRPLLSWIVETISSERGAEIRRRMASHRTRYDNLSQKTESIGHSSDINSEEEANPLSAIHARWLTTPREDLRGQSPRDVLFAKRDFVDFDLNSRELQWSFSNEGPPSLGLDSFAYRFAGFGTHEWVIYYDLVRHLIWSALTLLIREPANADGDVVGQRLAVEPTLELDNSRESESMISQLAAIESAWLDGPNDDYDSRIPAVLIENERKRLPIAMSPREMIVDENCPTCRMFADDPVLALGVGFWHLDGCNMDDDFVFSYHQTREEWEAERREWQEFSEKFNREWEEKRQMNAGEEAVLDQFGFSGLNLDSDTSISDT